MTAKALDAEAVFERIRSNITKSFEHRRAALQDIIAVHKKRLWKSLEYSSFEECLEGELKLGRFPIPRSERREAVAFLDLAGLTGRAIAASLGVSEGTVRNDISTAQKYAVGTARPTRKVGLDGKSRATSREPAAKSRSREPACLTPKAGSTLSSARELGAYAQKVGKRLARLTFEEIAELSFDELQTFADHIYRARHGLKNCESRLP